MPNTCIYCGHGKASDSKVSMFRFPADKERREQWLAALNIKDDDLTNNSRICSRHFLHGDQGSIPVVNLGKSFISPKKPHTERARRAIKRAAERSAFQSPPPSACKRLATTPSACASSVVSTTDDETPSQVSIGEPLLSDYSVFELPSTGDCEIDDNAHESETALSARVELLESQLKSLSSLHGQTKASCRYFRIESISDSDSLIKFYTGFSSFPVLLYFFEFLGTSVNHLKYWGDNECKTNRRRKSLKLDPINQLFLTLVKLRLDLRVTDLALRFGVSSSSVSKYFITWICFLYHYLKEIDWTPSVAQVAGTLPCAFREKFPTTYSIIDASEVFIQTPSDLCMQSSSWSNTTPPKYW